MLHCSCNICGRATNCGDIDYEVQKLIVENTILEREINQLYSKIPSRPNQMLVSPSQPPHCSSSNPGINATPELGLGGGTRTTEKERSMFLDLAIKALKELLELGEMDCPFGKIDSRSSKAVSLINEKYKNASNNVTKPPGHVVEASREIGLVPMTCLTLVKTFMDTVITFNHHPFFSEMVTYKMFFLKNCFHRKNGSTCLHLLCLWHQPVK